MAAGALDTRPHTPRRYGPLAINNLTSDPRKLSHPSAARPLPSLRPPRRFLYRRIKRSQMHTCADRETMETIAGPGGQMNETAANQRWPLPAAFRRQCAAGFKRVNHRGDCGRFQRWMVNGLHLYSGGHSKRFTISLNIHPSMHTFTHPRWCQPCKATASSPGAVRVRCLAEGHLDTRLGGAGDRNSNLPVTSQLYLLSHMLPVQSPDLSPFSEAENTGFKNMLNGGSDPVLTAVPF